jgi:putative GTP pyrophosphokinase
MFVTAASCLQKTANDHLIVSETVFTPRFFVPYQCAIESALKILCDIRSRMNHHVCAITFRLKSPASIRGKLLKKHLPATAACAHTALQDIAGLRVVLGSTQDVYHFADLLRSSPELELIEEHDYIALPKKSGYRSLHLIIRIPVYMDGQLHMIPAEIQLRTAPMDMWANIEHALIYKPVPF